MNKHIVVLYVLSFAAFSIAMGAAFGQRSDYLRLNDLGAPQITFKGLFR